MKLSFFDKLKSGLSKTRDGILSGLDALKGAEGRLSDEVLTAIEESLIRADIGPKTSEKLIAKVKEDGAKNVSVESFKGILREELTHILSTVDSAHVPPDSAKPFVYLIVGVNGSGKTTTAGKLAGMFSRDGKRVTMIASDTFRAAAAEQLEVWASRSGVEMVSQKRGGDPASVAYDGVTAAMKRGSDVAIIDTAGRLHTKTNLMEEAKKIKKVVGKLIPSAPHEVLLVLDATVGQNGINQAKEFKEALGVTGIFLAKIDGTAKGGVVVAINEELGIPVKFLGVGEALDDIVEFDSRAFSEALFS
ncbi:MAG: signal recognition particle-docking protein FtsY [Candidatus Eisenbacteria bacterium]|nr:signal recognition particle-docking protein FtsY [Candidatus Eisenbacteria bacterium]